MNNFTIQQQHQQQHSTTTLNNNTQQQHSTTTHNNNTQQQHTTTTLNNNTTTHNNTQQHTTTHDNTQQQQHKPFSRKVALFLLVNSRKQLHAVEHGCRQRSRSRHEKAAATVTPVLASWTANRRDGTGWSNAPRRSTETEASQCHCVRRPTGTEERRRRVLRAELRRGSGVCEGVAAGSALGAAAAGQGGAAPRRAHRWDLPLRSDPRCAWAADGGSGGGIHARDRHCHSGAGYRSAQALSRPNSSAFFGPSVSVGGTVGGSADGPGVCACDYRQEVLYAATNFLHVGEPFCVFRGAVGPGELRSGTWWLTSLSWRRCRFPGYFFCPCHLGRWLGQRC